jgi:hypothetical protein
MLLKDFYSALDQELIDLIQKYEADDLLRAHKNNLDNQKSYAFLIWFMEFYAKVRAYPPYVTDGRGDHSFDIVFPIPNQIGQKIFYVVQSKWKKTSNKHLSRENGKDEFLRSLQELDTVLRGTIPPDANDRVKRNLEEFNEHRRNNGEVKFIFLTLCTNDIQADIQHNIDTFQQNNPLVNIEVIDIERLLGKLNSERRHLFINAVEKQTVKLLSVIFLFIATGAAILSLILKCMSSNRKASFVG